MIDYSYFQKSKAFIYPILELPDDTPEPITTYLGIENFEFDETTPLICMYNRTKKFNLLLDKLKLNSRYEFDLKIDENFHIIIFDMSHVEKDYNLIIEGSYSKLSQNTKHKISLTFPKNRLTVLCFDPEKNRRHAEDALGLDKGTLDESEICSPAKMDTEGEILFVKDLKLLNEFYNK